MRIEAARADRVLVSGACGRAPNAHYKVSATWQDGWRAVAMIAIVGIAQGKAYGQRALEMAVSVPAAWFDAFQRPFTQADSGERVNSAITACPI